jgi:hypothetical protein
MISRAFTFFALLMSIAAFVVAVMAYQQAGGDLEELRQVVHRTRRETAKALDRIGHLVRGNQQGETEDVRKSK